MEMMEKLLWTAEVVGGKHEKNGEKEVPTMTMEGVMQEIQKYEYCELGIWPILEIEEKLGWDFSNVRDWAAYEFEDEDERIRAVEETMVKFRVVWNDRVGLVLIGELGPDEYGGWGNTVDGYVCDPEDQELVRTSIEQLLELLRRAG